MCFEWIILLKVLHLTISIVLKQRYCCLGVSFAHAQVPSSSSSYHIHGNEKNCDWLTKSDVCEVGVRFVNQEYDYRQNWTTRSPITNESWMLHVLKVLKRTKSWWKIQKFPILWFCSKFRFLRHFCRCYGDCNKVSDSFIQDTV